MSVDIPFGLPVNTVMLANSLASVTVTGSEALLSFVGEGTGDTARAVLLPDGLSDSLVVGAGLSDSLGDVLRSWLDDNNSVWLLDVVDNNLNLLDLLNQFLDDLVNSNNLSVVNWLLWSWGLVELNLEDLNLLLVNVNLLGEFLDLSDQLNNSLLLFWLEWSWLRLWLWFWDWVTWVNDVMDSSLDNLNLLGELSDDLLQDNDLLLDDRSLWLRGLGVLDLKDVNLLLDDLDLLNELNDLLLVNLNNLLDRLRELWLGWLRWVESDLSDGSLDVNNLLVVLLDDLLELLDGLLNDDDLLRGLDNLKLLLQDNDLVVDLLNLLNENVNLLGQLVNELVLSWGKWSLLIMWSFWFWLEWVNWFLVSWDQWSWSGQLLNNLLDINNLLVNLLDGVLKNDDLSLDNRLLWLRGLLEDDLQVMDLLLDDGNLVDQFSDLLLEDSNNLLLRLDQRSWLWLEWLWLLVNNDGSSDLLNSLLVDVDLVDQSVDSLVNDSWSFWFWLRIDVEVLYDLLGVLLDDDQLVDDLLDNLLDVSDLLSDNSDLLLPDLDLLDNLWLLWLWEGWELNDSVVDLVSDDLNLLDQLSDDLDVLGDLLLVDSDLLGNLSWVDTGKGWSAQESNLIVNAVSLLVARLSPVAVVSTAFFLKSVLLFNELMELGNLRLRLSASVDWLEEAWLVDDDVKFLNELMDNNLMEVNLLDDLLESLSEDVDLLDDGLLLSDVGNLSDLNLQVLDGLLDDSDLLDQFSDDGLVVNDLLSVDGNLLNEFLLDDGDLSLSDNLDLVNSVSDDLSNIDDLLLDDNNLLSENGDLLDDSSSNGLWSLDQLNDQFSDGLSVDLDLFDKLEDLGDLLDDNLLTSLDDSNVLWLSETIVVWLQQESDLLGGLVNTSLPVDVDVWVLLTLSSQLLKLLKSLLDVGLLLTSVNWGDLSDDLELLDGVLDLLDLLNSLSDDSSDSVNLFADRLWSDEGDLWDWLSWSDSVNSLLNRDVLLSNSLDYSLDDSNSLDDLWSLWLRGLGELNLKLVDSDDQFLNLLDNLLLLNDELLVNLLDDWVQWLWLRSVVDELLLVLDDSDGLLNVNNLFIDSLDNLLEFDNSLLEDWSLVSWDFWKFLNELLDSLSDGDRSLDQLSDLLLQDVDDLLFNLSERSWLEGFLCSTWLGWLGTVVDRVDGLLENIYLLNILLVDSLENLNLLEDDWLLWSGSVMVNNLKFLDSLVDFVNLLDVNLGLVNQFVNDSLLNLNKWSRLVPDWSWLSDVLDNLSDLGDLVGDLLKSLL